MNSILICPSTRPVIEQLATFAPLAALPLLGESLVEYWLTHLALAGVKEVRILAHDRPEKILAQTGDGARWGLKVEVLAEPRELTLAQAQIKFAREMAGSRQEITVLDRFPGMSQSLFTSYADLFAGILEWLPKANTPDRVGMQERSPGVWVGLHTRIAPDAKLHAPCWIGQNVYIGSGAIVGPMAIVEDRSFIEPKAEVISSAIGPDTFVGQLAVLQDAFAWGNLLVNWKTNLPTRIEEPFVLCALRGPALAPASESLLGRLSHVYERNKDELQTFWKHFLLEKEDKVSTHDKL